MENLNKVYAEQLASEYAPKQTSKVVQLKKLDGKVKNPPKVLALVLGIIGALVLGVGMCFALGKIGPTEGNISMIIGIIVGIVGIAIVSINYPIYSKWLKSRKVKYAFDITELAKEIAQEK